MLVTDTLGFSCISTGAKGQWVETRENAGFLHFPSSGGLGSQTQRIGVWATVTKLPFIQGLELSKNFNHAVVLDPLNGIAVF